MKTTNKYIQGLIDYLESKLCRLERTRKFKKVGQRSFFYLDEVDMIFVKITDRITDRNLIIITDGEYVIDLELMLGAPNDNGSDLTPDELYDHSLQQILALF